MVWLIMYQSYFLIPPTAFQLPFNFHDCASKKKKTKNKTEGDCNTWLHDLGTVNACLMQKKEQNSVP